MRALPVLLQTPVVAWLLTAALPAQLDREPPPLHLAAARGDVAEVVRLLDGGARIDGATRAITASQRDGGDTALMAAARGGRLEVVKVLLARGATIDRPNGRGMTALDGALGAARVDAVELLAKAGAKIGPNAFCLAAREPSQLALLFELGADANATNGRGETALHRYDMLSQLTALAQMLDHGASWFVADRRGVTPLQWAASLRMVPTLQLAKARGALADERLAANDATRVLVAVVLGDGEALTRALAAGAAATQPDAQGATPLQAAAELGRADMIHALVASGAVFVSAAETGWPPLHRAAGGGHAATLRALLHEGAPTAYANDPVWGSALQVAAGAGHLECAQTLIAADAAIDVPDDRGTTALLAAVEKGHGEMVELLLRAGADRDRAGGSWGQAPLHLAAARGHAVVVDCLLRAGAKVDAVATATPFDDVTPLMAAVRMGHVGIVRSLLAAGADRTARSPGGRTAIDFAEQADVREALKDE